MIRALLNAVTFYYFMQKINMVMQKINMRVGT